MKRSWKYWLVRSVVVSAFGGVGIVLLSIAMFHLELEVSPAGLTLLTAVVLLSLISGFVGSVVLSLIAVLSLDYFFIPPIFSLTFGSLDDLVALIAFLTTSIIITGLMARIRKIAEEELQQTRADLARFARVATMGELTRLDRAQSQSAARRRGKQRACVFALARQRAAQCRKGGSVGEPHDPGREPRQRGDPTRSQTRQKHSSTDVSSERQRSDRGDRDSMPQ